MAGLSVYDGILRPEGGLVTSKSAVDDLYKGIYPTPSNVARVTPEGLNVNKVQTVAIDPFTGNPVHAGGTTAPRTAAVLAQDPGRLSAGSATQLPPANYGAADLSYVPSSHVIARTVNPDGSYSDPLTAIDQAAAPRPTGSAWGGGWGSDGVGRFLYGDPGVTDWSKASQRGVNGLFGVPAQGFALKPQAPATVRSMIAARSADQGSGGSNPAVLGAMVKLASGSSVPSGTTGSAQNGAITYQVQPDGSVVNSLGRVTAPAPGAPQSTAQWANAFRETPAGSPFW